MRERVRGLVVVLAACGGGEGSTPATACQQTLEAMGIESAVAEPRMGVEEPTDVTVPIAGIAYDAGDGPRETFFMDCPLAVALGRAAEVFAALDVVAVSDFGIYNYRCIGSGTPPDCPQGLSQHALGRALDIAGVTTSEGTFYSVNDDWVIDPDGEDTCSAATETAADAFLHQLACDLHAAAVFNILLTPNYNADHRNHFHGDLTPETSFIE